MIRAKSRQEISRMRRGGRMLFRVKNELKKLVLSGKTPLDLEKRAQEMILMFGAKPSFQMVRGYRWATCVNVNQGVVHGVPTKRPFKVQDIVSVDVGSFYQGLHTDSAFTMPVGKVSEEKLKFLAAGREALLKSVLKVRVGAKISDISRTIEQVIKKRGYSPVRDLTGHGVGRKLHEAPAIPCFWQEGMVDETIPEGATLAIEVIYAMGLPDLQLSADNWTISTKDGKLAGLFEETVVALNHGPFVLTNPSFFLEYG